jgi:HK97 gp10 family phage protein
MASATYSVTGLKQLEQALVQLGKSAGNQALSGALRDAARPAIKAARNSAPQKSGDLKRGIKAQVIKGNGQSNTVATLLIGYDKRKAWHGRFIEKGTKPHTIPNATIGRGKSKRKNKSVVSFGGNVYASVNHPGIQAKPLLLPAFSATYKQSIGIFKQRLNERIILRAIKKYGKSA